jgi:hypothetical protein
VLGAWLAKESVRDLYLADTWREARTLLDKTIAGCLADDVPEIVSLGNTLRSWRQEILAHHTTGASNSSPEGLNLCVRKVKRCAHGMRSFENYRLRVLLHAGRRHPAGTITTATHPNPRSPLIRVEPTKNFVPRPSARHQPVQPDCLSSLFVCQAAMRMESPYAGPQKGP